MRTNMKTVLFAALACALFVTACQKEESANLQENNTQVVEPAAKVPDSVTLLVGEASTAPLAYSLNW